MIQAGILLGGAGTRLGLTDRPKPMLDFCGKPLLERTVVTLVEQGVTDLIFLTHHMGEVIQEWFGDGSSYGAKIQYCRETVPRGTAGAALNARDLWQDEFLMLYGDTIFDVDLALFIKTARKKGGAGTLFVHPNDHPYDSDLVQYDSNGRIKSIHGKPHSSKILLRNRVNAGLYYFKKEIFDSVPDTPGILDWGRDIFPTAVKNGVELYAYNSAEYIKDIGTKERVAKAEEHWRTGIIKSRSYRVKQRAIFFDRDGVVNREIGGVLHTDQMELLPKAAETIAAVNSSGFMAICVTNQPILAKGFISEDELNLVHARLDQLLSDSGAYFDELYYCPHHPESGHVGEVQELKIKCDCRKPSPGLLLQAAHQHNIDLKRSYLIGDRAVDIEAGRAAGCHTVLVYTNQNESEAHSADADYEAASIYDAFKYISEKENQEI